MRLDRAHGALLVAVFEAGRGAESLAHAARALEDVQAGLLIGQALGLSVERTVALGEEAVARKLAGVKEGVKEGA